jgi:hypothetical protein
MLNSRNLSGFTYFISIYFSQSRLHSFQQSFCAIFSMIVDRICSHNPYNTPTAKSECQYRYSIGFPDLLNKSNRRLMTVVRCRHSLRRQSKRTGSSLKL